MNAFNSMLSKTRDRNWGGTASTVACEPYVSGYAFIKWQLPENLIDVLTQRFDLKFTDIPSNDQTFPGSTNDGITTDSIASQLSASCMSVTPPGGTLNKVTFQGLGGSKWSVPGSIDYGTTISIKYTEFSGLPIARIHRAWCNMIRDNKIGLTQMSGGGGKRDYNKKDYSATLLYWTTKPDGVTVEYAAAYSGVFPTKDPLDAFSGDINSVDKLEIDIEYSLDRVWHEDWVYSTAQLEAKKKPYGVDGATLWSSDGYRYQEQKDMSSI